MNNWLFENLSLVEMVMVIIGIVGMTFVAVMPLNNLGSKWITLSLCSAGLIWTVGMIGIKSGFTNYINDEYKVEAVASGKLGLYKKETIPEDRLWKVQSVDVGNGIAVEKRVPLLGSSRTVVSKVLTIQCNQLNYEECVQKVKESLETILVAGADKDGSTVVQF